MVIWETTLSVVSLYLPFECQMTVRNQNFVVCKLLLHALFSFLEGFTLNTSEILLRCSSTNSEGLILFTFSCSVLSSLLLSFHFPLKFDRAIGNMFLKIDFKNRINQLIVTVFLPGGSITKEYSPLSILIFFVIL